MATAAAIVACAIAWFLIFGGLEDAIKAWHNGKANIEAQKALGAEALHRAEEQKTRQEELKLERARLEHSAPLS